MFCPQCGVQCSVEAKFCCECGSALQCLTHKVESPSTETRTQTPVPMLSEVLHSWKQLVGLMPRYKIKPDRIELEGWIFDSANVVFTDDLFVVTAAPKKTGPKAFGDKLGSNVGRIGFAFGLLGGAVALTTSTLGEVYEKLYGANNSLDQQSAQMLFSSGLLIYARKRDLTFRMFNLMKPIFYTYQEVLVAGLFEHTNGPLEICLPFFDDHLFGQVPMVKKGFKAGRCVLHVEKGTADGVQKLLDSEYPWRYSRGIAGWEWEFRG